MKHDINNLQAVVCGGTTTRNCEQRVIEEIGESLYISRVELGLVMSKLSLLLRSTERLDNEKWRLELTRQQRVVAQLLATIEPLKNDYSLASK